MVKQVLSSAGNRRDFYIRDAQGNVMAVYKDQDDYVDWTEQHLYGSSRLGIWNYGRPVPAVPGAVVYDSALVGATNYELSNHLGNVLATISDKKRGFSTNSTTVDYYVAEVLNQNDYYPFGMMMPGRSYSAKTGYRYGFNGKENDNEVMGEGNSLDFGARVYEPRLGRWLSIDPMKTSWQAPYTFVSNSPSGKLDPDGKWETDGHYWTVMLIATILEIPEASQLAYYAEYPDTEIHGQNSSERYTWGIPTVQQGTHSLTGGSGPDASLKTTRDILKADFKNMEELGRLLHKLGDTYAHRVIGGKGQLYGGDFFTLDHAITDGHKPDLIKLRMDDGIYEGYVQNLTAVLATKYEKYDNAKVKKAVDMLAQLGKYAKDNNVSLKGIINYEVAALKGESTFFIHRPTSYLNESNAAPDADHKAYVKSTSAYLTKKGIKFTTKEIMKAIRKQSLMETCKLTRKR